MKYLTKKLIFKQFLKRNLQENDCFTTRYLSRIDSGRVANQITAFAIVYYQRIIIIIIIIIIIFMQH